MRVRVPPPPAPQSADSRTEQLSFSSSSSSSNGNEDEDEDERAGLTLSPAGAAARPVILALDTPRTLLYGPAQMITVTDSAFQQLHILVGEQDDPTKGLRIFVESGGCAGMQYGMTLDHPQEGDEVLEKEGARVMIDARSREYLHDSTVDYVDDLAGAGFRIKNPNAVRSCGCGTSFETADAEHAQH